jgi:hypothetical protein
MMIQIVKHKSFLFCQYPFWLQYNHDICSRTHPNVNHSRQWSCSVVPLVQRPRSTGPMKTVTVNTFRVECPILQEDTCRIAPLCGHVVTPEVVAAATMVLGPRPRFVSRLSKQGSRQLNARGYLPNKRRNY